MKNLFNLSEFIDSLNESVSSDKSNGGRHNGTNAYIVEFEDILSNNFSNYISATQTGFPAANYNGYFVFKAEGNVLSPYNMRKTDLKHMDVYSYFDLGNNILTNEQVTNGVLTIDGKGEDDKEKELLDKLYAVPVICHITRPKDIIEKHIWVDTNNKRDIEYDYIFASCLCNTPNDIFDTKKDNNSSADSNILNVEKVKMDSQKFDFKNIGFVYMNNKTIPCSLGDIETAEFEKAYEKYYHKQLKSIKADSKRYDVYLSKFENPRKKDIEHADISMDDKEQAIPEHDTYLPFSRWYNLQLSDLSIDKESNRSGVEKFDFAHYRKYLKETEDGVVICAQPMEGSDMEIVLFMPIDNFGNPYTKKKDVPMEYNMLMKIDHTEFTDYNWKFIKELIKKKVNVDSNLFPLRINRDHSTTYRMQSTFLLQKYLNNKLDASSIRKQFVFKDKAINLI